MKNRTKPVIVGFEPLEGRAYFSTPSPWVVSGTEGPDQVYIRYDSSIIQIYVNEGTSNQGYFKYDHPPVNLQVTFRGLGGNDRINLREVDFGGSVRVEGGAGDDKINIGEGTYASRTDGPVTVIGGSGKDELYVDASQDHTPELADIFRVGKDFIGWGATNSGGSTFEQWEVVFDSTTEFAQLKSLPEASTINVAATAATTYTSIVAGSANDKVSVGGGDVDSNIKGTLSILAGAGTDTFYVNDAVDSGDDSYFLDLSKFNKYSSADVFFSQFEKTQIDANLGNDNFYIKGVNSPTTINGSGGDDHFFVGSTGSIKNIRKDLSLDGGTGKDEVIVNDSAETLASNFAVTATQVSKLGTTLGKVKPAKVERVEVQSGAGNDQMTVTPAIGVNFLLSANGQSSSTGDQMFLNYADAPMFVPDSLGGTFYTGLRGPVVIRGFEKRPHVGASISGMLFNDRDHDGIKDGSLEEPLPGRTVYLDLNNNKKLDLIEPWTATNGEGKYLFLGLNPGTYKVRQVLPAGWQQTSPANGYGINVTVADEENKTGKDFGSSNT